jgi:hypothetical protein
MERAPPPGAYETNYSSFNRTGGVMSRSKRSELDKEKVKTPGPGNYNPANTHRSGRQYSFTRTRFFDKNSKTPGPEYNPKPVFDTKYSCISFGSSKRDDLVHNKEIPGPGQYEK